MFTRRQHCDDEQAICCALLCISSMLFITAGNVAIRDINVPGNDGMVV